MKKKISFLIAICLLSMVNVFSQDQTKEKAKEKTVTFTMSEIDTMKAHIALIGAARDIADDRAHRYAAEDLYAWKLLNNVREAQRWGVRLVNIIPIEIDSLSQLNLYKQWLVTNETTNHPVEILLKDFLETVRVTFPFQITEGNQGRANNFTVPTQEMLFQTTDSSQLFVRLEKLENVKKRDATTYRILITHEFSDVASIPNPDNIIAKGEFKLDDDDKLVKNTLVAKNQIELKRVLVYFKTLISVYG